jgi:hypothetical protein
VFLFDKNLIGDNVKIIKGCTFTNNNNFL